MTPQTTYIKHFANLGDLIASLAAVKGYWQKTKKKVIFCQQLDVPAFYYQGATHPTLSQNGVMVMMNKRMFDMVKPLVLAQEYIADMQVLNGQNISIDFDTIRKERFVNIPHQVMAQWLFIAYPDAECYLSEAWVNIPEVDISGCSMLSYQNIASAKMNLKDKIIVNFTERYRNHHLNYFFLKKHEHELIFTGTQTEHEIFCTKWELQIPLLYVNNFLELAYIIKQSKFFLGNQSFLWNICEAAKIPRLLEICEFAPNCQPFYGKKNFGYYHQAALEWYFKELSK